MKTDFQAQIVTTETVQPSSSSEPSTESTTTTTKVRG
jgi:hypothetical protein